MPKIVAKLAPVIWSIIGLSIATIAYLPSWLSEGSGMRFVSPWFLLGLIAVPLVVTAGMLERRSSGRIRFPLARALAKAGPGWRAHLLPVSVGLKATIVALVMVALARPQDSSRHEEMSMEGIDIITTIDVSGSMSERDLFPTRVEATKEVVEDFVKRPKHDRIGAVIFAQNAYTLCPLTLDYSVLTSMIRDIQLGMIDGGRTAIGNAVARSINRLRKSDAKSKVIILLTDGTSNAGNVSPEQATLFAQTLDIKIYTVLMGATNESNPINPELLIDMSRKTGGEFFEATNREDLESSFHSILDALERSRIEDAGVMFAEVFGRYLWPAFLLLLIDLLLGLVVIRRSL